MTESVAAVIVTYNRKALLRQALDAVLGQDHQVDHIFVIDNASTDGTDQALTEAGYDHNPSISYIKLDKNTGGAGGFHEGMKRAFNAGYEWLWLMDDDGYPAPDCLIQQLTVKNSLDIIGATVVQPQTPSELTWTLICYDHNGYFSIRKRITSLKQLMERSSQDIYHGYGAFFNAILIRRTVVASLGLVNQDLFIRGDEFEYFLRCRQSHISMGTQVKAVYYHPYQPLKTSPLKFFYAFRNAFYNYTQYSQITYTKPIQFVYLVYIFIKFMTQFPSLNPRYFAHVLKAVYLATRGTLLPYQASLGS